jgi:alpha-glucosidase
MRHPLLLAIALSLPALAPAGEPSRDARGHEWWRHAVFYEIYPRSFADADGNGIGDLGGITSKLDYLKSLGVDAIWITPCYPSPQVDFGYDVSDYRAIAPEYGTLADFDRLMAEATRRGIRIVMDLVMNHTSDRHPWFVESRASRESPKRDWYVWRDGSGRGKPPNNWISVFGGSAWQWDERTGQYYYHFFYKEQPDLNWRNPAVKDAYFDVARYWMERGVAGFRLDAIGTLFEDPALADNPVDPGVNWLGDPNMRHEHNTDLPEVHDVVRDLRQLADSYPGDRVLIGETGGQTIAEIARWYGAKRDEFQLPMNFRFANVNKLSAPEFRQRIADADTNPAGGWPVYLLGNHDEDRQWNRYGDGVHNDAIARLLATMLLTLRGTPILYYGEELGMENNDPERVQDVKDPIGKLFWPKNKGRDGERTPMQWDATVNAGFSRQPPWLPVPESSRKKNVAVEDKDPGSLLNLYRRLTALRRSTPALLEGEYRALLESDPNVLAYLRRDGADAVVVALNMSDAGQKVRLDLGPLGLTSNDAATLLSTVGTDTRDRPLDALSLAPFEGYVGRVK